MPFTLDWHWNMVFQLRTMISCADYSFNRELSVDIWSVAFLDGQDFSRMKNLSVLFVNDIRRL